MYFVPNTFSTIMLSYQICLVFLLLILSTTSAEPPHIVSIGLSTATSTSCAGTLLNRKWIITTATCITQAQTSSDLRVFAGCRAGAAANCSSVHHVASMYIHPCFTASSGSNDIALIRLMAPGVTMVSIQSDAVSKCSL